MNQPINSKFKLKESRKEHQPRIGSKPWKYCKVIGVTSDATGELYALVNTDAHELEIIKPENLEGEAALELL